MFGPGIYTTPVSSSKHTANSSFSLGFNGYGSQKPMSMRRTIIFVRICMLCLFVVLFVINPSIYGMQNIIGLVLITDMIVYVTNRVLIT